MPIYEYECAKCGARFERLIRNARRDVPGDCPKCGAPRPVRVLSAFSVGSAARPATPACASCPSRGETCPYGESHGDGCD